MGRAGMLQCANNFACKFKRKLCMSCGVVDDENHRINHCVKWARTNRKESPIKTNFGDIYSSDDDKCQAVLNQIMRLWDLANEKNEMRKNL